MHPYVSNLQAFLEPHANAAKAKPMSAYMKDKFPFLGIKSPERRALLSAFLKTNGLPERDSLDAIILGVWQLPEREYQYCAIGMLEKAPKGLTPESLSLLEALITTKSWWDTVDAIASHLVGRLLLRYPESRASCIGEWRKSKNLWLRRTTLLFQLGYKQKTDAELLFSLIRDNLGSSEFFINKAIGWALREYSKTEAAAVRNFISGTSLAPLSQREAVKWLERKTRDLEIELLENKQ